MHHVKERKILSKFAYFQKNLWIRSDTGNGFLQDYQKRYYSALLFGCKSYGRSVEHFPSLIAMKCIHANVLGHISALDASILILKKA